MAPPTTFLFLEARAMNSFEPISSEPSGAPMPFDRQSEMESQPAQSSAGEMPSAAHAFITRAPSMCSLMPRACTASPSSSRYSFESTRPPHLFCVFSTHTRRVTGKCGFSSRMASSTSAMAIVPSGWVRTTRGWIPATVALPPCP